MKFVDQRLYATLAMACNKGVGPPCNGANSSDKIQAKLTLATTPTTAAGTALSSGNFANIAAGPVLEPPLTNANINSEISDLKNAVKQLQEIKTVADSTLYTSDETLVKFVTRQVFKVEPSEKPPSDKATEIATHIKETYGSTAGNFQTKIWKKVKNTEVSFNSAKAIETKQLSKVTPEAAAASSISVSLANKQNSDGKACPLAQTPDNKMEKCVGKRGASCTGDCELDGDISKPTKQGEGENKEKTETTNTTGRNSVLIKRAPLWFAFLVL
ncbi:hypothetical protein DPX39_090112000 [Trypanosoma brucei equiperdum]|uniref:Variant surface glycoprotein n=2 Tax=Trypanosoma brucei TaxID=5691 RepID=A0A3L6L1R4_9TRYP|nr:variant surface glycoprotein 1125.5484 [Trypanosoma brucei]RHW70008.1 hypothetical protein DPX39_090112000 [Trypanosoma brucei equiperdum]